MGNTSGSSHFIRRGYSGLVACETQFALELPDSVEANPYYDYTAPARHVPQAKPRSALRPVDCDACPCAIETIVRL